MRLEKTTVKKLEHMKNETAARMQARRTEILGCIALDQKNIVIIDPDFKAEAKSIHKDMTNLRQEVAKFEGLIDEVKAVAEILGIGNFNFEDERSQLNRTIVQNDQVIRRDVIQDVMSRERCAALEGNCPARC